MRRAVLTFLKTEAGGGALLALSAIAALIVANSAVGPLYTAALKTTLTLDLGVWQVESTLKDWVKDGLMALFFFVVGLELKRELTLGELSDPKTVLLPVAAAFGGVVMPVLVYSLLAGSVDPRGWPVPVATDIAFALAALAVLAPGIDTRVRLFLLTLAVVDDLMAIVLIGVLFTHGLALGPLLIALALLAGVFLLSQRAPLPVWVYPVIGLVTWGLAKEAGVHTSVMAVAAAMIVPSTAVGRSNRLEQLEHALHPLSAYFVLPVFAFCAAGVSFAGLDPAQMLGGVSAGVALGLALGKPVGVGLTTVLVARLARVPLPFSVGHLISVGCLCGIGFTMSLFIGGLAFAGDDAAESAARLGVLSGSVLSLLLAAVAFRIGRSPAQKV